MHLQNNSRTAIHRHWYLFNLQNNSNTQNLQNNSPTHSQSQSQHVCPTILIQSHSQHINPQTHIHNISKYIQTQIQNTSIKLNSQTLIHKLKSTTYQYTNSYPQHKLMSYRTSIKPISCIRSYIKLIQVFQLYKQDNACLIPHLVLVLSHAHVQGQSGNQAVYVMVPPSPHFLDVMCV